MIYESVYEHNGVRYGMTLGRWYYGAKNLHVARFYDRKGSMVAQGTSDIGRETAVSYAKRNLLERLGSYANDSLVLVG